MENPFITVFTPAYNRADTLPRVFEGLKKQTYKNFEWIIIDDGSSDNTKEVVEEILNEKVFFNITYKYQQNSGKHIAINRAVEIAKGEFFIILDSDDTCTDNALECFVEEWYKIPENERNDYYGISCRCCDLDGNIVGTPMSADYIDCNDLDLRLKYKIKGELWGMTRIEILKNTPFPEIEGLHFYPENIYWHNIGRKYKSRYINKALRYYINDTDNALTASKKTSALKETFFMRKHFINDCWDYVKYDRKKFLLQIIGLSRDGLAYGLRFSEIRKIPNTAFKRFLTVLFYPAGYILFKRS